MNNGRAMSKIGQPGHRPAAAQRLEPEVVRFKPPDAGAPAIDTLNLAQLRERGSPTHLASPQRLEFLMLMLYTRGRGEHLVDFVSHRVGADTLIVVQPGSVHRFDLNDSMDARLLVVDPVFMLPERLAWLKPLLGSVPWPVRSVLRPATRDEFLALCGQIEADGQRQAPPALRAALARQRLYTLLLLLRIEWDCGGGTGLPDAAPATLLAAQFRDLLERHHAERWTVQDYARKLGYAERTLTRACQATSGHSAKALIDQRVLLEAKRLLAHSGDSVEAIALRLGFGGASPLVQYFRRLEGCTPKAFRLGFRA